MEILNCKNCIKNNSVYLGNLDLSFVPNRQQTFFIKECHLNKIFTDEQLLKLGENGWSWTGYKNGLKCFGCKDTTIEIIFKKTLTPTLSIGFLGNPIHHNNDCKFIYFSEHFYSTRLNSGVSEKQAACGWWKNKNDYTCISCLSTKLDQHDNNCVFTFGYLANNPKMTSGFERLATFQNLKNLALKVQFAKSGFFKTNDTLLTLECSWCGGILKEADVIECKNVDTLHFSKFPWCPLMENIVCSKTNLKYPPFKVRSLKNFKLAILKMHPIFGKKNFNLNCDKNLKSFFFNMIYYSRKNPSLFDLTESKLEEFKVHLCCKLYTAEQTPFKKDFGFSDCKNFIEFESFKKKEAIETNFNCLICKTKKPEIVFFPCGHFNICKICAATKKQCPACNIKTVEKYVSFF